MSWVQTHEGIRFNPMNVDPDTIDIIDIAHSLSLVCRFNGHCRQFYSVAQHCVLMSEEVDPQYAIHALLHDAAEAYIADVCRPIKPFLKGYSTIEENIMDAVYVKFGLAGGHAIEQVVKIADNRILMTEKAQLLSHPNIDWGWSVEPYDISIRCWMPLEAEMWFLTKFHELMAKEN